MEPQQNLREDLEAIDKAEKFEASGEKNNQVPSEADDVEDDDVVLSSSGANEAEVDDVSLSSSNLDDFRAIGWGPGAHSESDIKAFRKQGGKYARVTGLYIEGLEARVRALENDVLELQASKGEAKQEEAKSTFVPSLPKELSSQALSASGSCTKPPPLEIKRQSIKELKGQYFWSKMAEGACIILCFAASTEPVESETFRPLAQHNLQNGARVDHVKDRRLQDITVEGSPPKATRLTRLFCKSPWLTVVIELLGGDHIPWAFVWIYPFKHIVVYERQLRKFVELLNDIDLDSAKAKDLVPTLNRIAKEVTKSLGPKRAESEFSNAKVRHILRHKREYFDVHFEKADKAMLATRGQANTDDEADSAASHDHHGASTLTKASVNESRTNLTDKQSPKPGEEQISELPCTCLKEARDHLQLVIDVLDEHLTGLVTLRGAIAECTLKRIHFRDLWNLYQPGDLVVSSKQPYQAYRVTHVSGGRPLMTTPLVYDGNQRMNYQDEDRRLRVSPFKIDCVKFDFDGEKFGPIQEIISIFEYDDERKISELDVYPIQFAEDEDALRETLVARGKKFEAYREFQHKKYAGLTVGDLPEEMESEVMIDFTQAFRQQEYRIHKPEIGLRSSSWSDVRELYEDSLTELDSAFIPDWDKNWILEDTMFDNTRTDSFLDTESDGMLLETRHSAQKLTKDQLILLPYRVHAFSLRTRDWGLLNILHKTEAACLHLVTVQLNIESVLDIQEDDGIHNNDAGFDDLVIPEDYKRTVKALVKSHTLGSRDASNQHVDLIRGKGKGLIILLHGVPGVGKTSTAESIAAYSRRPLFPITCGDIGQTAKQVEERLEKIFFLARKWGCVLLLDEADVFLEKRERAGSTIARNALVSVFLRTLEYYSGILFLTTNRIGSFDEAFISRIHMMLYYPDLDQTSTYQVWTMNLDRIKRSGRNIYVDNDGIRAFAKQHWEDGNRWNGRQIRNAFQTALALAEYDFQETCKEAEETGEKQPVKPKLKADHFKAVAKTSAEFDNYLFTVYGGSTHKDKARETELRSDAWQDRGIETPTGKRYSTERAIRPRMPINLGSSDRKPSEQVALNVPVPQNVSSTETTGPSKDDVGEADEYKKWLEEEERQEKYKRFQKMRQEKGI